MAKEETEKGKHHLTIYLAGTYSERGRTVDQHHPCPKTLPVIPPRAEPAPPPISNGIVRPWVVDPQFLVPKTDPNAPPLVVDFCAVRPREFAEPDPADVAPPQAQAKPPPPLKYVVCAAFLGARALPEEQFGVRALSRPQPTPPLQYLCLPLQCAATASLAFILASVSSNLQHQHQAQGSSGVSVGRTDPAGGEEIGREEDFAVGRSPRRHPNPHGPPLLCRCNKRIGKEEKDRSLGQKHLKPTSRALSRLTRHAHATPDAETQ
jgi:hypothetical protein